MCSNMEEDAHSEAPLALSVDFEGRSYTLRPSETVFEALLRGGADVRYSCKKGTCQTCVLELVKGEVSAEAFRGLSAEMRKARAFLPCVARPKTSVAAQKLDRSRLTREVLVAAKEVLGSGIVRLSLEPPGDFSWQAGQFVTLQNPSGDSRAYSLTSSVSDYFLELHIRHYPDGRVSNWIALDMEPGGTLGLGGPLGSVHYRASMQTRPLVLLGTGTGMGMLLGIAREARRSGHEGEIVLGRILRPHDEDYLSVELAAFQEENPNVRVLSLECSASLLRQSELFGAALPQNWDETGPELFLAGSPQFVFAARVFAVASGFPLTSIHADPFHVGGGQEEIAPRDKEKLAQIEPDRELWLALGEGQLLTEILTDFYTRVYRDPRLAPFFERVTLERAIEKQYSFLRDVFSGSHDYFGAKPYNAHHWMVIADELFDYREELFFQCVRRTGLPEPLIRRWAAFHELFREDLVKGQPRGLFLHGQEQVHSPYSDENAEIDLVCDGCNCEIRVASRVRLIHRSGRVFCEQCMGKTPLV
jgi:NAD(P)H-flavin reductase/truncated hemoglobin YjbI/ferredoxin